MVFNNRQDAAERLAEKLASYRGQNPLVLAVPRGAVPMGRVLAQRLRGELDVVLVHKLGAPGNPEFAVGSVDETGQLYLADYTAELGIGAHYLEQEKESQLATLRQRRREYTPVRPPIDPRGRIAIVVDDGIATGATMIAALRAARAKGPKRLIAAVAVAPPDAIQRLAAEADEVVCLHAPEQFHAVGQFFRDFPQVSDAEVIRLLHEHGADEERH